MTLITWILSSPGPTALCKNSVQYSEASLQVPIYDITTYTSERHIEISLIGARGGLYEHIMAEIIRAVIAFFLSNYALTYLLMGLVASVIAIIKAPKPVDFGVVVEKLLAWFVFFNVGVGYFYNFIMHGFFGKMSAAFIGWSDSPFQFEVASASLGFAVVGFIAAFRSYDLRLAAIVGPSVFTLGAAFGHVRQMVAAQNFAPGNAGIIFYMDIVIPLIGFALLWLSRHHQPSGAVKA